MIYMDQLYFQIITSSDNDLARTTKQEILQQIILNEYISSTYTTDKTPFLPENNQHQMITRHKEQGIVGRTSYFFTENNSLNSLLTGFYHKPYISDKKGNRILHDSLDMFPGYEQYRGKGKTVFLSIIDMFVRGKGFGTETVRYLQSKPDIELIELEANGNRNKKFFENLGFKNTGLYASYGHRPVMVWNNPYYDNLEKEIDKQEIISMIDV
ncbi:MAG: GNAT family N-acetyltransferase [Nanobdellota archaeon]